MSHWVRLWEDMPTDPKWRVIARRSGRPIAEVLSVFCFMLTNAGASRDRGTLDGWNDEDVAAALDMDAEHVAAIREAMQGKTLDGERLTGWERRQPKREDGAAERAKDWRERKRTQANAPKRPEDIREETEKEKKEREAREARLVVVQDFDEKFWPEFPNKVGRKAALRSWEAAMKRGVSVDDVLAGLTRYKRDKPPDRPWLNPATFLNQERWADEPAAATVLPFSAPPTKEEYTEAERERRLKEWRERGFFEAAK
jgi:hypothetical protein